MSLNYPRPSVAVIIPCRNEEAFIARCLDSILANDYPSDRLEIIVADGMSEDRTRSIVDRYATRHSHIRVLNNPEGTIPAAMNRVIRRSRGQVVMKVDAHSSYPTNYIAECVRYLFDFEADMAGGICSITPRNNTLTARTIAVGLSHWFASGNAYVKTGSGEPRWADAAAFGCWKRETLEKLGPFDERLTGSSDMDFNVRLRRSGGRILLMPQIKVTYYADADLKSFWKHNFNDGLWTTYVLKFGKWASSWRHWIPLGFVLSWFAAGLAAPFYAPAGWAWGGIGAAYLLAVLTATAQVCMKSRNWSYMKRLPIVFATRHIGHGLGALYGLVLAALPGVSWRGRRAGGEEQGYPGRRGLDVVGSLAGLCILSPFFVLICILIKLDSCGPVLYRGDRIGKSGKPFRMIKFRTLHADAAHDGVPITPAGDRRITRVGRFLRKYKLDELPQLFNVLKGEMSLVGPRPEASFYFQYYDEDEKRIVQSVRPGMTDYGSLRFHDEERLLAGAADPVKVYLEQIRRHKVREQLRYIREQSLATDLKIILRTIAVVLSTRLRQDGDRVPEAPARG